MVEKMDVVLNWDYWDGVAATKDFNKVCYGFHDENTFYGFTEPIEGLESDMRFLDFGCGPGRIVKTVAPQVKEYVGVDSSVGILELAREHHKDYPNVSFFNCNARDLSRFEDESFDYVYERLVLIHVPKEVIIGYLKEFYRVLRTGGILNIPDLPREDVSVNGLTLVEVQTILRDFGCIQIQSKDNTWKVWCVK
jgi:ubiquinone/menaquinone biosynthesis C-methylase UbiE